MQQPLINANPFYSSELFKAVQMSDFFPDSKTFCDYIPNFTLEKIQQDYLDYHQALNFDLNQFIKDNFTKNPFLMLDYKSDTSKSIEQHLEDL